jgi:hypothetical protein
VKIIVVDRLSERNTRRILKRYDKENVSYYVDFTRSIDSCKALMDAGVVRLSPSDFGDITRADFLKEYIGIIDSLCVENSCPVWWSTELATRNHFATVLADRLAEIVCLKAALVRIRPEVLVVVSSSVFTAVWLRDYALEQGLSFTNLGNSITLRSVQAYTQNIVGHICRNILLSFILLFRMCLARVMLSHSAEKIKSNPNGVVLIKTFAYPEDFKPNQPFVDRMFGELHAFLERRGCTRVILCHINHDFFDTIKKIKTDPSSIYPYEYFLTLPSIARSLVDVLTFVPSISSAIFFQEEVRDLIKAESHSAGARVNNYAHAFVANKLLRAYDINRVILTYENRAWENAFILGLRKEKPSIPIVGYQHTVVVQAAAGYFIGSRERECKPLPDKILTVGDEMKSRLLESGEYLESTITSVGALRFTHLWEAKLRSQVTKNNVVLVVLEGVLPVGLMVLYVLSQAKLLHGWKIRIRSHRELPWSTLSRIWGIDLSLYQNVEISENISLASDLNECDICMYWGSAVAIEALHMAIPLIHFDSENALSFDPLEGLDNLKWTTRVGENLFELVNQIHSLDVQKFIQEVEATKKYLQRLFQPPDPTRLQNFL